MVTHQKEVHYRLGIWQLHFTHKTTTVDTRQPKDGHPPEGSVLHTWSPWRVTCQPMDGFSPTQGWLPRFTLLGPIWHHLAWVAHVWPHLALFGPIWSHLALFGPSIHKVSRTKNNLENLNWIQALCAPQEFTRIQTPESNRVNWIFHIFNTFEQAAWVGISLFTK